MMILSKGKKQHDFIVLINGKEVNDNITPIKWSNEKSDDNYRKWEYYMKRGCCFYFRRLGQKIKITSNDFKMNLLRQGEKYDLNFD